MNEISFCREATRYNYPESVISKFPWRKIGKKIQWVQKLEDTEFRDVQRCFKENQDWLELFQKTSAVLRSVWEKISTETDLVQRWFRALKFGGFSAVQSRIRSVQRFSGNELRWIRTETFLNQSWSVLIYYGKSTRVSHYILKGGRFISNFHNKKGGKEIMQLFSRMCANKIFKTSASAIRMFGTYTNRNFFVK